MANRWTTNQYNLLKTQPYRTLSYVFTQAGIYFSRHFQFQHLHCGQHPKPTFHSQPAASPAWQWSCQRIITSHKRLLSSFTEIAITFRRTWPSLSLANKTLAVVKPERCLSVNDFIPTFHVVLWPDCTVGGCHHCISYSHHKGFPVQLLQLLCAS